VIRVLLFLILAVFVGRALWRLLEGVVEGASGVVRPGPPARGVAMVRDPVCGTYVIPSRALKVGDGDRARYFCSEGCRARYRARAS
jgi:YHS domain-containing protein